MQQQQAITFYKATAADAQLLCLLAMQIYQQHYLHLWHDGGAQWYMYEYAYAPDKIEAELADDNVEYYIAAYNNQPQGYMKLVLSAPGGDWAASALEVERIYLHKAATGSGIGRQLMQLAAQRANAVGKNTIVLKAMDSSTAAIAFYQQQGYTVCGTLQLPMPTFALMKEEYRGMVVMQKKLQADIPGF
jgi:diamine N-acetyltransferase